ncbi:MAG: alanine--tRNA ligase [Lachnospiraceae bacterium]|nr:alanine--tRNA ligase [Lachnospiraceae bacterium]
MEYMGLNEIREKFLAFFESKEHLRMPSASLVPQNDNSLLLINSGMAPLKPFFTGQQIPPRKRVTTCQKCIRTGDIENVGKTARHGTFFEMLGDFSFGDYFKNEIIPWSWEFVTETLGIPEEKLYVTVYQDDDEAAKIWHEKVGLPKEKIFYMGKADNFWEHGTGPCGPCSEIYYDRGEEYGCGKEGCTVGCDCDRYMEFWNLVFTQFNAETDGTYTELEMKNIDTGMGLERMATIMQGVDSIFDVDTVKAVRDAVCAVAGVEYMKDHKTDVSIRVITDHIRSVTFMTADGVLFSNEGRGYVLRRLLRRAARHGKLLGINGRFLAELSKVVIEQSKDAYPELEEKKDYIYKIINVEEERFYATLDLGLEMLQKEIEKVKAEGGKILSGEATFKLYDTYGFPTDLMEEILVEHGLGIDLELFKKAMDEQRQRAREARGTSTYMGAEETVYHRLDPAMSTEFVGYNNFVIDDAKVLAVVVDNDIVNAASEGDEVSIILDKTPFYGESGGQCGDKGVIRTDGAVVEIADTTKFGGNKWIHTGKVVSGEIVTGDTVTAEINYELRMATARNHTTTHLLQKALRTVLGTHVEQAGSFVSDSRLRFDFTHFEAISKEDLLEIEKIVNKSILDAHPVTIAEMTPAEAKAMGAMALFGEKYGEVVRVVNVNNYSIELCGGTHLTNSAQAGSFKIVSETGVAAGVRRIEALTGYGVLNYYESQEELMNTVRNTVKANGNAVAQKVASLVDENKKLAKEIEALKAKLAGGVVDEIINTKEEVNGVVTICAAVKEADMNSLKNMGDDIKARFDKCVVVLVSAMGGKVNLVAMANDEAVKAGAHCGNIIKAAATACGGGGGGRPNMAQAGGKDVTKVNDAVEAAKEAVKAQL